MQIHHLLLLLLVQLQLAYYKNRTTDGYETGHAHIGFNEWMCKVLLPPPTTPSPKVAAGKPTQVVHCNSHSQLAIS